MAPRLPDRFPRLLVIKHLIIRLPGYSILASRNTCPPDLRLLFKQGSSSNDHEWYLRASKDEKIDKSALSIKIYNPID